MSTQKGCNFCIRYGFPILPVRPAVMSQDDILAQLPSDVILPVPAEGETAYTARQGKITKSTFYK